MSLQNVKRLIHNCLNRIEYLEDVANGKELLTSKELRLQLMSIHVHLEEAKQENWNVMMKNIGVQKELRKLLGEVD